MILMERADDNTFMNFKPRGRHISCVREFVNRQNDVQERKFPMVICTRPVIAIFRFFLVMPRYMKTKPII